MAKTYESGNVKIEVKKTLGLMDEWAAIYYVNGKRDEDKTYYGDSKQDVEDTAQFMIDRLNQLSGLRPELIQIQGETLEQIAVTHLEIETLETRNSDDLDFHSVAVWNIKAALRAAFVAGRESK